MLFKNRRNVIGARCKRSEISISVSSLAIVSIMGASMPVLGRVQTHCDSADRHRRQ